MLENLFILKKIAILACLIVLSSCTTSYSSNQYATEGHLLGNSKDPADNELFKLDNNEGWFQEYQDAYAPEGRNDSVKANKYLKMGIALSRASCNESLDKIEAKQNNVIFGDNELKALVILGTGILGINNAKPDDLIRLALGAAFVTTSTELYKSHYLLGPDSDVIVAMIRNGMEEVRVSITSTIPEGFIEAYSRLESYSRICSSSTIRRLVREAIEQADFEVVASAAEKRNQSIVDDIAKVFNRFGLSQNQMGALYWALFEPPAVPASTPSEKAYETKIYESLDGLDISGMTTSDVELVKSLYRELPILERQYSAWVAEAKTLIKNAISDAKEEIISENDEKNGVVVGYTIKVFSELTESQIDNINIIAAPKLEPSASSVVELRVR